MKIQILSIPDDPERIIWTAARTCTSFDGPVELWEDHVPDKTAQIELARKLWGMGHYSVFEHVSVVYGIEGISRACLAQLTRHRHLSFSVQSQRYVDLAKAMYCDGPRLPGIVPESIARDPVRAEKFQKTWETIELACDELRGDGVPKEDVRFLFPLAVPTNLVVTCNLRSLGELYAKRVKAKGAQWEIRDLVDGMVRCLADLSWFVETLEKDD